MGRRLHVGGSGRSGRFATAAYRGCFGFGFGFGILVRVGGAGGRLGGGGGKKGLGDEGIQFPDYEWMVRAQEGGLEGPGLLEKSSTRGNSALAEGVRSPVLGLEGLHEEGGRVLVNHGLGKLAADPVGLFWRSFRNWRPHRQWIGQEDPSGPIEGGGNVGMASSVDGPRRKDEKGLAVPDHGVVEEFPIALGTPTATSGRSGGGSGRGRLAGGIPETLLEVLGVLEGAK